MYITQDIANKVKLQAKKQNISMKKILSECSLNINAVSEFAKGKQLSCVSLAKIADYLNVSVDYLLGRTENIAVLPAQINFDGLNEQENKIINFFRSLNDEGQEKAFDYITDLVDTNKYKKHNKLDVGKEA